MLHFTALSTPLCTAAAQQAVHVMALARRAGSHIVTHLKLVEKVRATCGTQCLHVMVHELNCHLLCRTSLPSSTLVRAHNRRFFLLAFIHATCFTAYSACIRGIQAQQAPWPDFRSQDALGPPAQTAACPTAWQTWPSPRGSSRRCRASAPALVNASIITALRKGMRLQNLPGRPPSQMRNLHALNSEDMAWWA